MPSWQSLHVFGGELFHNEVAMHMVTDIVTADMH